MKILDKFFLSTKKAISILGILILGLLSTSFWLIYKQNNHILDVHIAFEKVNLVTVKAKHLEHATFKEGSGKRNLNELSVSINHLKNFDALADTEGRSSLEISKIMGEPDFLNVEELLANLTHTASSDVSNHQVLKEQLETLIKSLNGIQNKISKYIEDQQEQFNTMLIVLLVLNIIPVVFLLFLIWKRYVKPLTHLSDVVKDKESEIYIQLEQGSDFETVADTIKYYNRNLLKAKDFIKDIGEGKLDQEFAILAEEEKNSGLPAALIEMRKKMKQVAREDNQRKWATEGLAKFVEILRANNDDINELSYKIISNLVQYVKANQGGLFLVDKENASDIHLALVASYAYEKRKYLQRRIELGEGLIGQAVLEADTIYMTDIPHDYVKITSGLGGSNPGSLLIVPLIINGEVYGAVELASFHKFEKNQIEFIQKLTESIASTISTARVNERTKRLLENSQQLTEELRAQEEEVRQNMEELSATQEEMQRINQEIQAQNGIINKIAILSKTDLKGNITYVNDEFLKWSKYTREEVIGKNHRILKSGDQPDSLFDDLWKTISSGKVFRGEIKNKAKDGSYYWVDAIIAPILDTNGKPKEYIAQRFVINDAKEKEEKLKQNMELLQVIQQEIDRQNLEMQLFANAVGEALILAEYAPDGNILIINQNYERSTGYTSIELMGKDLMSIIDNKDRVQYRKMWKDILEGKSYKGEAKMTAKNGEQRYYMATYSPVAGPDGKTNKIYYLAQDISETKLLELEAKNQTEELRAQEEELRQNMEELSATQEEMQRIYDEMEAQNQIINSVAIVSKTDLRGNITYVNDEFLKWSKYSREEVIGKNHRILKSGDQPDSLFQDLWKTISSGKIFRGEIKNRAKDGSFYWVDAIIAPVLDSDGRPKEYIAQRFVINDAKEKEEKLQEALRSLDEKSKKSKI